MEKYCGNAKPYIYALFGESDRGHAEAVMEALSAKGHSLWYADVFNKKEEARLQKAAALLVVISPDFADSDVLKKAVGQATKANIPIIVAYREWVKLSPGLSMQLGTNLGVVRTNFATEEEYLEKLCGSPVLSKLTVTSAQKAAAKQTSIRFGLGTVGVVAALILVVLLPLLMSGSVDLAELILPESMLQQRQVYVYGGTTRDTYSLYQQLEKAEDGDSEVYMVLVEDGTQIPTGGLTDVTTFAQMTDLTELCLAGNSISDITPLSQLKKLELLDLSGNNLSGTDLSPLAQLPELETLNLAYTRVSDLKPLRNCDSLKTLYLSQDNAMYMDSYSLPGVEVVYVDAYVRNYEELKAACDRGNVTHIFSKSDISIPEGETLTIPENVMFHHSKGKLVNKGTLQVNGTLFADQDTYSSEGALHIGATGVFRSYAGVKQAVQNGSVTVEKGGNLIVDWGTFIFGKTALQNDGYVVANGMGVLALNFADVVNNGTIEVSDGSDAMMALAGSGIFDVMLEIKGTAMDVEDFETYLEDSLGDAEVHLAKGAIYGDVETFRGEGTVIGEITTQEEVADQFFMMGIPGLQQAFGSEFAGMDVQYIQLPG